MRLRGFVFGSVLALTFSFVGAQTVHRCDEVNGMTGQASLYPNQHGGYTTLVFSENQPTNAPSSQIVFVLQTDGSASVPSAWAGPARILSGDGFIAVLPQDKADEKWLLKFSDRGVPPRLASSDFQQFSIVGIARYGEGKPLTSRQVSCLISTGANCGPA